MNRLPLLLLAAIAAAPAADDAARANAYDDAWQATWVAHCRAVAGAGGKTAGLVLQVGDSITHANPYGQWPRRGDGKTVDDAAIISWCHGDGAFSADNSDTTDPSGWYLAGADTNGQRGMTASGGLASDEFLAGDGNGGTAMPDAADQATARALVADGATYTGNLRASTVASAFADAQVAVLMLGTNDVLGGRSAAAVKADLLSIVGLFEARGIVVVLSTIPPQPDATDDALAAEVCDAIRALASEHGLPLIDYRAEILARRADWNGTLITLDDVHPTAGVNGYSATSDPYADGGDPATLTTGAACLNSGYLLRSWLTVQKLKEVKSAVFDAGGTTTGGTATAGATTGGTTTGGTTTGGTTTGGTTTGATTTAGATGPTGHHGCGAGGAAVGIALAAGLLGRRRA